MIRFSMEFAALIYLWLVSRNNSEVILCRMELYAFSDSGSSV